MSLHRKRKDEGLLSTGCAGVFWLVACLLGFVAVHCVLAPPALPPPGLTARKVARVIWSSWRERMRPAPLDRQAGADRIADRCTTRSSASSMTRAPARAFTDSQGSTTVYDAACDRPHRHRQQRHHHDLRCQWSAMSAASRQPDHKVASRHRHRKCRSGFR